MKHKTILFIGIVVAAIIFSTRYSDFTNKYNLRAKPDSFDIQKYHNINLVPEKRNPVQHIVYIVAKKITLELNNISS